MEKINLPTEHASKKRIDPPMIRATLAEDLCRESALKILGVIYEWRRMREEREREQRRRR